MTRPMLTRTRLVSLSLVTGTVMCMSLSMLTACSTQIGPGDGSNGGNDAAADNVTTTDTPIANDGTPIQNDGFARDAGGPTEAGQIDSGPIFVDATPAPDTLPPRDAGPPFDGGQPMPDAAPPRDVQLADVQTDAPPQYPDHGGVITIQTQSIQFGSNSSAGAAFYDNLANVIPGNCMQTTAGNCTVLQCTGGGRDAGMPPLLSAGNVTIHSTGTTDVVLTPDAMNQYQGFNDQSAYWSAGAQLDVSAAGATIPAFATSLDFPPDLTVTSPVLANPITDRVQIDRSAGLPVAWDATTGVVTVTILQVTNNTLSAQVACTFPGSDGGGTIAPNALSALSPSPGGSFQPDAYVVAGGSAATLVMAGTYSVDVTMQNNTFFAGAQIR